MWHNGYWNYARMEQRNPMADARGYLKLAHGFPEHPKVEAAGGDAGWLHICALAYCSRNTTDGFIPARTVLRISDREDPKQLASKLLEVGLWHASEHTCPRCPKVPADTYYIHDYLQHQNSAERIQEVSQKRAAAGQQGGKAKAAASKLPDPGYGSASSKSLAEEEEEEEEETKVKSPTPRKRAVAKPVDPVVAERTALATQVLQWWWEQLDTKPAGKNAWHASLRVITNLLAVGHEAKAIAAAAREIGTPLTTARMEIQLGRNKAPTTRVRPSTTTAAVDQGMDLIHRMAAKEGVDLSTLLPASQPRELT